MKRGASPSDIGALRKIDKLLFIGGRAYGPLSTTGETPAPLNLNIQVRGVSGHLLVSLGDHL
jgi:hypothetical protein